MIGNSHHHHHLFILVIAFMCLLLLPLINCTNPDLKESTIAKEIHRLPMKNPFIHSLRENQFNMNSEEDEQLNNLLKSYLATDQHRRALAFHAMRGKRSIQRT